MSLAAASALARAELVIDSVSNRPDKISGGDVLVRINLPAGITPGAVRVELNGADVSHVFMPSDGGSLLGLVQGLELGKNRLRARARGARKGRLQLVNHPVEGPVFSGPRETPFFCETEQFSVYPGGPTLGPALDASCSIATRVDFVYRSTDGSFKPLADPGTAPADVVTTITTEGNSVPYIVRIETGTINRSILPDRGAWVQPLDPSPDLPYSDPAWNGRLVLRVRRWLPGGMVPPG